MERSFLLYNRYCVLFLTTLSLQHKKESNTISIIAISKPFANYVSI